MKHQITHVLLVTALIFTVSCSTTHSTAPSTLHKYHSPKKANKGTYSISGLRHVALRDTALSTGARAGLSWRAQKINQLVAKHERQLDLIYNFNAMLLEHNILPPILIEGRHTLEQTAQDIIRVADRTYSIQAQARFVTMAPTWREYLLLQFKDPDMPDVSLQPRTQAEKEVWDKYVDEGWQIGVTQADVIFSENLGRLKRDFEGMIRYRSLLTQNMVSLPYVAQLNLGITGGNEQMAINDRVLRITALPSFNTKGNEWHSEVTTDER